MTNAQKAAITTWVQTVVALAALFIPGLTDAMQIAIMAVSTSTLTMWVALTYKDSPTRMNDDAAVGFEEARVRLATKSGILMPSVAEAAAAPATVAAAVATEPPKEGWPPPQDNS